MLKLHFERRKEDYAGVAIALYFGEIVGVFFLFSVLDCSDLLFLRQFPIELLECDCSFYVIALFVWALLCVFPRRSSSFGVITYSSSITGVQA